jgi:hypothetical protein
MMFGICLVNSLNLAYFSLNILINEILMSFNIPSQRRNEGLPTMHCVHYYSQLRFLANVNEKVVEIYCDFWF